MPEQIADAIPTNFNYSKGTGKLNFLSKNNGNSGLPEAFLVPLEFLSFWLVL